MKTKIIHGLYLFVSLLFISCEYPWSVYESIYVANDTTDSIRIALFNDVYPGSDYSCYLIAPQSASYKLVDISGFFLGGSKIRESDTGLCFGLLVYHPKDSACIFLNNGYPEDVDEFYKYISTSCDIDNEKRIINAHTEIKITDVMLQEMTKNTQLTDSIFGF